MPAITYKRILLKLSGEALMGDSDYGIDPKVIGRLAREIIEVQNAGVQVGVVIGGGNIFRGAGLAASGMDRVTGDHMGMLATVMNALALQDAIERAGATARTMSAIRSTKSAKISFAAAQSGTWKRAYGAVCGGYRQSVLHHRFGGRAACHRNRCRSAAQGHQGDGVYSADPSKDPQATRYDT